MQLCQSNSSHLATILYTYSVYVHKTWTVLGLAILNPATPPPPTGLDFLVAYGGYGVEVGLVWLLVWFGYWYGLATSMVWQLVWFDYWYGLTTGMVWQLVWFSYLYGLATGMVFATGMVWLWYGLTTGMVWQLVWFGYRYGLAADIVWQLVWFGNLYGLALCSYLPDQ